METKHKDFRQMVRVLGTDIPGEKPVIEALRKVRGISYSLSNVICKKLNIDKTKKLGSFSEKEVEQIEALIKNPNEKIPTWMLNRQKDYDTGEDKHLLTTDIRFRKDFDVKRLQKIKSRRGLRHQAKLPVRGQRTKAHFRHGAALGVKKKSGAKKGRV